MLEMKALSLFSGIGGMDLAAEAAGIRTAAMCELDPFCRSVLRKYWPDIPIYEDIKKLEGRDVETRIDVIHGGPPCQPASLAGRRRGKEDERYLWDEVFRLIGEITPDYVVCENVPGIITIAGDEICKTLESLGYSVGILSFEAACVGAPHRRMRVFFVAYAKSGRSQPQSGERRRDFESRHERTEYQIAGSGQSSVTLSDAGCRLFTRSPIRGTVCGEFEEGAAIDAERPDSSPVADTCNFRGLQQNRKFSLFGKWPRDGGKAISFPPRARDRSRRLPSEGFARESEASDSYSPVSYTDRKRLEEQQLAIAAERERASLGSTECCSQGLIEPCLGGVAHGPPCWLDGRVWWGQEPDIPRIAKGVKDRVARLRALGNCVVPAQVYPIFRAIIELETFLNGQIGGFR
jgi:DNA (cytosine-5)-methyltransferase 1